MTALGSWRKRVALAAVLAASTPTLGASVQSATLNVETTGAELGGGQVFVGVCNKSFDEADCPLGQRQPAKSGAIRFSFKDLPPGRYAIAAYHDVNANGRLDKQTFGLPAEPYGFSNDVGRIAPPSYERALIDVREPTTSVSVRLKRISLTP